MSDIAKSSSSIQGSSSARHRGIPHGRISKSLCICMVTAACRVRDHPTRTRGVMMRTQYQTCLTHWWGIWDARYRDRCDKCAAHIGDVLSLLKSFAVLPLLPLLQTRDLVETPVGGRILSALMLGLSKNMASVRAQEERCRISGFQNPFWFVACGVDGVS